jgi:hypothetical protein
MIVITAIHQQGWQQRNMKECHRLLTLRLALAPHVLIVIQKAHGALPALRIRVIS